MTAPSPPALYFNDMFVRGWLPVCDPLGRNLGVPPAGGPSVGFAAATSTANANGFGSVGGQAMALAISISTASAVGRATGSGKGVAAASSTANATGTATILTYNAIYVADASGSGWGQLGAVRGSYRTVGQLTASSLGKVRVTLELFSDPANSHFGDFSHVSFGKWTGANADCTTVPVELKFGGVSGITGPRSGAQLQTIVSDVTAHPGFTLNAGESIVVVLDSPTSDNTAYLAGLSWGEPSTTFWWFQNVPLQTWNVAAPGVTAAGTTTQNAGVNRVETETTSSTTTVSAVAHASGIGSANGFQGGAATLIWSEEFDTYPSVVSNASGGASDTTSNWRYDAIWQNADKGYRDFAGTSWNVNPNDPAYAGYNPFSISGSVLTIKSFRTPAPLVSQIRADLISGGQSGLPDPAWCSGLLVTNSAKRKFRYGYIEFRAQWPNPGRGMWPALWLFSSDGSADALNKGQAEIDLLEQFGQGNSWTTTLHEHDNSGAGPSVTLGTRTDDTAGWHTYAVDWQPTYLKFYYDNILVYTVTGADATFFNTYMNILIDFTMDGTWFPPSLQSDGTTPNPMNMNVDYIRVYTTKP